MRINIKQFLGWMFWVYFALFDFTIEYFPFLEIIKATNKLFFKSYAVCTDIVKGNVLFSNILQNENKNVAIYLKKLN